MLGSLSAAKAALSAPNHGLPEEAPVPLLPPPADDPELPDSEP
jgi:hypothetical protein